MSGPRQALEAMGLLKDRLTLPEYQKYMQGFMDDVDEKDSSAVITDIQGRPSGLAFCNREVQRLKMAEAYYVSAEMMTLTRWAAAGLDVSDRFDHDVWPTDFGFLFFEDALLGREMWGRKIVSKALTWGRTTGTDRKTGLPIPGTMIVTYTDMDDPRDEVNLHVKEEAAKHIPRLAQVHAAIGSLLVHHMMFLPDGLRVGPEQLVPPADYARYAFSDQVLAEAIDNDGRFILALMMLMNQTVTSTSVHEMDRHTSKRFGRMKIPSKITVIQLRRHAGAARAEGESMVEWAHRWVVRGHWRNQPYKGEGGETVYRRIWIAPFIKGPDDAPLKQSEKVYAFVR